MPDVSSKEHLSPISLKVFIGNLVKQTDPIRPQSSNYSIVEKMADYQASLAKAFKKLSRMAEKKKITSSGVEWFLDNYYVIQEAIELIQDDLPEDYFSKLPSTEDGTGIPRIYQIARAMVAYYQVELVRINLTQFLNAYQEKINLQMSELWALPLMLRLVLIETLSGTINDLIENETPVPDAPGIHFSEIVADEVIARSIRTLLLFDRMDWKDFFEDHSYVEKILRKDPARVYPHMDFETRDQYRKKIEALAERSDWDEAEVAQAAIELAGKTDEKGEKTAHVGFYLIGNGEEQLKTAINYRYDASGRLHKFFFEHNTAFYLGGILTITLLVALGLLLVSRSFVNGTWQLVLIGLLSVIPASSVAVNLINSILTATLPPRVLPKMDFSKKIPNGYRTMVAVPALLANEEEIQFLLRQLELHYLSNKDRNIGFVLLSDFSDAPQETMPEDQALLRTTLDGLHALNERYRGDKGRRPFYLFHRRRQWNPQEDSWIGWERKRGKLADFNRYLLEHDEHSFDTIVGELDFLKSVRFVITVDADTVIPRDSANALIATLAHPLNRAEFKEDTSQVTSGYTILQPRTEVKPTSVIKSLFTRVFAGDLGLDLYTRAVSDVYQDLFGEGIYVGKGIYDVAAFERSLKGKVPQNALLSHDLFEGLQGRAALVSDIVFFEDYPPDYASQVHRLHRWVRGDWQLFPWLFPQVPQRAAALAPNPFSAIDRWKILDNLRRSLVGPATLLALVVGWFLFQDQAWVWTLLILFVSAFTLLKNIVSSLSSRFLMGARANVIANIKTAFFRWVFWLIFLPYESLIMLDAVVTTLVRVYISHKRLLQWQTSAHTIRLFGKHRKIKTIWKRMIFAPLFSVFIGVMIRLFNPGGFWESLPLLVLWAISPQIAYWTSRIREKDSRTNLTEADIRKFRNIARQTWLYFEQFVGPEDHWLPPDHFQEDPKGMVAHRTSPTNIGLMLLSTASAYDLGYIGVLDFVYRTNYTFEALDGLEKYSGHLLNWYDTQTTKTLSPRYVSTVDSGNFATSLIGLHQSLTDLGKDSLCPARLFQGIFDSLDIFCSVMKQIESSELEAVIQPLYRHCRNIQRDLRKSEMSDSRQIALLNDFKERLTQPMSALIEEILNTDQVIPRGVLQDLRYWSDAIYQHLANIQRQIDLLAPWVKSWQERPSFIDNLESPAFQDALTPWREDRALSTSLSDLPALCDDTSHILQPFLEAAEPFSESEQLDKAQTRALEVWMERFINDLGRSKDNGVDLFKQIETLMHTIDFYIEKMDFGFLFDKKREVFYLGYQVGSGQLDQNHYDLLASEARTASLFAIAKNDVPRSHWLHMSRPFTTVSGIPTMLSWNGSMFEYLMPNLFTRIYPETLLSQTSEGVVRAQMDYGKQHNIPWGISESSYYRFDQAENYQYQGFGVPGLGRKRGLADDLVVAPYASIMAVSVRPKAVIENIHALEKIGALGHFGFFESIDYTPARLPLGQDKAIIKTYMAHHQGMILVALANFLNPTSNVDRVHADPRIESTELLLQEQIPQTEPARKTKESVMLSRGEVAHSINATPWRVAEEPGLAVHALSNGQMRMIMTNSGSGYLAWNDITLTRWRQDAVLDPWGIWFYLQDLDKDKTWSIGQQPLSSHPDEYQVFFAPHMTEIRRVENDLRVNMQTTLSPEDNICLQKITLTNQTSQRRCFRLLSYGEVSLAPQATDRRHPAFNKMFIESKYDNSLRMLHFQRRPRSSDEKSLGMAHLVFDNLAGKVEYESDRGKFIGRGHDLSNPAALSGKGQLSGTVGVTLDPIFSLGRRFTLEPHQPVTFTFMTLAAENRKTAVQIAQKYQDGAKVNNAFAAAELHSEQLLRALDLESQTLAKYEQFLSRILYPIPELRPEPALLAKNTLGQAGLWPFGISGDYPILLAMVDRQEEVEALQETLQAHAYWRKCGLMIDLVILNTKDAGYTHELNAKIHHAITVMDSDNWVNQRGGIFVLTASVMEANAVRLLETTASVVLDFKTQNLEDHLRRAAALDASLPPFLATGAAEKFATKERISRPENLFLDNGIGGFTADGREYQIFLENYPKLLGTSGQITPAPWINVAANENFGFMVSESGSGYTWAVNSGENRLTPWTNDPVSDPPGESLYLRDEITGEIWSPTPHPAGEGVDFLVRHGQGYTLFESVNQGFKQRLKLFTAADAPVKIIELTLANLTGEHRRLTATYYAEWVLGADREKTKAFILPSYDNRSGSLMARNTYSADFSQRVAFLTSDRSVHGLTTDRREFLGEPGSRHAPAGLRRLGLSGRVEAGLDPCAALQTHLNFAPGEAQKVIFILGQGKNAAEAGQLAEAFSNPETVAASWDKVREAWDTLLNTLQVETPAPDMDLILNRWLQYQALSCRIWGRSAFYQSSGAYGFRDQLQDVTTLLTMKPETSREHILRSARHQFDAGDVLHWWHPPSNRGVRTRITDDLLWLVYVTAEYVTKTGDASILKEEVPFLLGEPLLPDEEERYGQYETSTETYTLFEHCRRALDHGDTQGPHGLPLIGRGDWNDGMNRVGIEGRGESIWLAWFLYENHRRFASLCEITGNSELAKEHLERADALKDVINQIGWDGQWFLRAFYDDGTLLGSHLNEECQIDSLPQSWAVLTGGAPEERQREAMDSVETHLVRKDDRLICLFTPPFDETEKDPGYIKGYPPGIRENGGQYTHAAIWATWALTKLGRGNAAFEQFQLLNPVTHSLDIESANRYAVEPYVVAADIYSRPPFTGRGGWTWYTGSSGWLYRLGTEAILGFRLAGDHFTVDPCIPADWDGFKLTFRQKDCTYQIEVKNPQHVEKGLTRVILDGEIVDDGRIPLQDNNPSVHQVTVWMGN